MADIIVTEKRCPRCTEIKPISEWYKSKGRYDGLSNYCKACMKIRRALFLAKPGKIEEKRASYRVYRQRNAEKERQRHYKYGHSERGREKARQWYWDHYEKSTESRRCYRGSKEGKAVRARYNKAYNNHPEKSRLLRDSRFRKVFGISLDEYEAVLKAQGGKCAICRTPPSRDRLSVDHCHTTTKFRGLLCRRCNFALGLLKDSPDIADRAAAYLRQHAQLKLVV